MVDCLPSVDSLQTRIDNLAAVQGAFIIDGDTDEFVPGSPLPDGTLPLWT